MTKITIDVTLELLQVEELARVAKLVQYITQTDTLDVKEIEELSFMLGDMQWAEEIQDIMSNDICSLARFYTSNRCFPFPDVCEEE